MDELDWIVVMQGGSVALLAIIAILIGWRR